MASDQQQLVDWLQKIGLARHVALLTDDNGDFGFRGLSDVRELSEEETEAIAEAAHMNIGERKRFLRSVKTLQEQASGGNEQAMRDSGDTGKHAGAAPAAAAGKAGAPQAPQQDQAELEALRAELERQKQELQEQKRQREALEQQRLQELEEMERKREADQMEQRRQQEFLEEQQLELEKQRREQLELQRDLEKQQIRAEETAALVQQQQQQKQQEWFLVVKSMVFVKSTPHKDAESLATVKRGEWLQVHGRRHLDDETNQWVELTAFELQRRSGCKPPRRGFALIDGTEMGIGRLLEGPFDAGAEEPGTEKKKPSEVLSDALRALQEGDSDEDEEVPNAGWPRMQLSREQIVASNWADEELRLAEQWAPEKFPRAHLLPQGVKVFSAAYDFVYAKRSEDTSRGGISKLPCKRGACFFSTGARHVGPQGGEWIEEYSRDGASRWLLIEGPGFQTDGPLLVDDGLAADHVAVAIHYVAPRRSVCLFRTLISRSATVQKLAKRLCIATGLTPNSAMLVPKAAPSSDGPQDHRMLGAPVMAGHPLLPHMTLESCGFKGETDLFLAYAATFEEDYREGALLSE